MSNKITGKVLAIQLGRDETRIVLLGNGDEVLHAVSMPTTAGAVDDGAIRSPEAVRAMLKKALEEPEFKRVRQAVFTLCTSQVITETITTPDLPAAKLEKLLRANADMYFPVDIQEYNLVWQVIGNKQSDAGQKELAVQLWAVPNAMLKPYYTVANACGLSVAAIDYCGHSMATAAGASFADPKMGKDHKKAAQAETAAQDAGVTTVHLLLERDLLGMTFVQKGQVVMQRLIRCGSDPTYQFSELAMMLEYFRATEGGWDTEIRGVVSGCHADNGEMVAELADMLGISVARMDAAFDMRLTLCMGAARTELDFGIPSLNVGGKARREMQGQLWQYLTLLGCGAALVGIILFTLTSQLNWSTNISRLENQRDTLTVQYAKVADYSKNYENYQSLYNAYSSDWETVFASLQTYNNNLVLVMDELEDMLPDTSSVVGMEIGASGLNVTFATETKEEAAYLIMALREMEYADLMEISDLVGGGAGPAESYGSGKTEKAPTEGSSSADLNAAQRKAMYDAISADLNAYAVAYNLGMGVDVEDRMGEMKNVYVLDLKNNYETYDDLKKAAGNKLTRDVRIAAFSAMCTANPFCMDAAESMLYRDYLTGGSLGPYIQRELEKRDSSIISVYRHRSVKDLQADIEILVDIIVDSNGSYDALADVEKIICKDDDMEAWYIYYLEAELNAKPDEEDAALKMPYLDMDAVITDMLDGEYNTRFASLNKVLNSLTSATTQNVIKTVNEQLNAPVEPEKPSDPENPGDPENPDAPVDNSANATRWLKYYLTFGTTSDTNDSDNDGVSDGDALIADYLTRSGEMQNQDLRKIMDDYVAAGNVDTELTSLLTTYRYNRPNLSNTAIITMLENYEAGTTGNTVLDQRLNELSKNVKDPAGEDESTGGEFDIDVFYELMLNMYLQNGNLPIGGEKYLEQVYQYFTEGTSGTQFDAIINDYVNSGKADDVLKSLLYMYQNNPDSIANDAIREMFDNYYKNGTTGNEFLDAWIKRCEEALKKEETEKPTEPTEPEATEPQPTDPTGPTEPEVPDIELPEGSDDVLNRWLKYYLTFGTTGDTNDSNGNKMPDGDELIVQYLLLSDKMKDQDSRKKLDAYVKSKGVDAELKELLFYYLYNKASLGNEAIVTMFDNYYEGTTGNPILDERIKAMGKEIAADAIQDAINNANGGGGGGGGQTAGPEDTRIFFAVVLNYSDELRDAELNRKGLAYDDKLKRLEVDE